MSPLALEAGKDMVKPIPKRRKPKRPVVPHEWDNVRDPKERRKAQNRSAQRTFRAKARGSIVAGTCPTTSEYSLPCAFLLRDTLLLVSFLNPS